MPTDIRRVAVDVDRRCEFDTRARSLHINCKQKVAEFINGCASRKNAPEVHYCVRNVIVSVNDTPGNYKYSVLVAANRKA